MTMFEITVKLPEDLARDAEEFGILNAETLASIIQMEVDRRVNDLVNEEVHLYRTEKQSSSNQEDR